MASTTSPRPGSQAQTPQGTKPYWEESLITSIDLLVLNSMSTSFEFSSSSSLIAQNETIIVEPGLKFPNHDKAHALEQKLFDS